MARVELFIEDVFGNTDPVRAVIQFQEQMDRAMLGAMVEEAQVILAASKEIVPLEFGPLRDSGQVTITSQQEVEIGYFKDYALVQHENPNFRHAPGRTWKYLERPTLEAEEGMEERLALGVQRRIDGSPA